VKFLQTALVGFLLVLPSRGDPTRCKESSHLATFTRQGEEVRWPSAGRVVAGNDPAGIRLYFSLGIGETSFQLVVPE
jgi:hypothetical protein